jgi:hypothetical protein
LLENVIVQIFKRYTFVKFPKSTLGGLTPVLLQLNVFTHFFDSGLFRLLYWD